MITVYQAAQQAGHKANSDQNSLAPTHTQLGVQVYQCFVDERVGDGRRVTASRAFLPQGVETFVNNPEAGELTMHTRCTAAQIVLESGAAGPRARGVRFLTSEGDPATATARNEVVLTAGVIGSPHLLLLSGIGPQTAFRPPLELDPAGEGGWQWPQCAVALESVGKHLVDHPRVACRWASVADGIDLSSCYSHVEGCLYARSARAVRAAERGLALDAVPDIQIQQDHVRTNDDMLAEPPLSTGFNLKPHVAQPRSEGTVSLLSADPRAKPRIDPCYLSDSGGADLQCLVEGITAARRVVAQRAFDFCRGEELLPGKDVQSQQQLEAWVGANVDTGYHPVGTCRMAEGAADGVVDGALRVHGVSGLRVADASVFPHIPNGNTQAATFMVAERAAEMILAAAAAAAAAA